MEISSMTGNKPLPGSSLPPRRGSVDEAIARLLQNREEKKAERARQYAEKVQRGEISFPYKD